MQNAKCKIEIKNLEFLILFFVFLLLNLNCYAQSPRYIRVAVMEDAPGLRLKVKGHYEIINSKNKGTIYRGRNLNTTVIPCAQGILFGNIKSNINTVTIRPRDADAISINARPLRGKLEIIKKENSHFLVINNIELEDYVKGISIREISHYWPPEALKAGVIVFRTFALYKIEESRGKDYDLSSDAYSQVYSGRAAERYRINKAADETAGLTLVYEGKIFPAFYHATCSGHTESASRLWNIDIAPLKGVACSFCKDSPHFKWHYVLSLSELRDKLNKAGFKIEAIREISVLGRDESSRITELKIGSLNQDLKISAKDFRQAVGANSIRSTNFAVRVIKDDAVFEGLGWGHGVGLCQWGAYFMAKYGYKYDEILKFYYPGSQIKNEVN